MIYKQRTNYLMLALALFVGVLLGAGGDRFLVSQQQIESSLPRVGIGGAPGILNGGVSQKEADFKMAMRKLWEDHVAWTRMYLISAMADAEDADSVAARLLKNQEDIGNAVKPYYGNEAGDRLTTLLKEHITIATEIVSAAKTNNDEAFNQADKKWFSNADQIAEFLSQANPNWSKDSVGSMLEEHLELTKQETVNILNKRFDDNIADYDEVREQILEMSDALSEGIVKQFPDKF